MGEISEAILDGLMCEVCGEVFEDALEGDDPPGFPRRCPGCDKDWDLAEDSEF